MREALKKGRNLSKCGHLIEPHCNLITLGIQINFHLTGKSRLICELTNIIELKAEENLSNML